MPELLLGNPRGWSPFDHGSVCSGMDALMARGKPLRVITPPKPGKLSHAQPKPCPTCYRPMVLILPAKRWECHTHGEPTRQ